MAAPHPSSSPRALDAQAVRRIEQRLQQAGTPPWLHGEVATRMAERLSIIKQQPRQVLDWGSELGASGQRLRQAYPGALITGLDVDGRPTGPGRGRWLQRLRLSRPAVATAPDEGAAQLVWSNLLLQRVADPPALIAAWQRALAVDGFLMFSTLGPGTLAELRSLYRDAGWGPPMAPLVDMHDLGDMLVQAGLADPVMDQEVLRLHWSDASAALAELRGLGGNADPGRHAGLRTPRWRRRLEGALAERADPQGRIGLSFEVVYGHAFKPLPRPKVAATTQVSLQALRDMVRRPPS